MMKKQNVNARTILCAYFGFGTVAGIIFALLVMAISNTYITRHDQPVSVVSSVYHP